MTDWYFYLDKGKTSGPFGKNEIAAAISRGQLGPFDLIYREGEEKWLPLHQFPDFKPLFKSQIKEEIEESWVVLVRRDNERGVSYLQRGPFSTDKVKKMLLAGDIRYRDFIWREGQAQWSRISTLELFAPPPVEWKPLHALPQDVKESDERSREQILKEVVSKPPAVRSPVQEAPPLEAEPVDLADAQAEPPPSNTRGVPRSKTHPTTKSPLNRQKYQDLAPLIFQMPKERRISLLFISAVLATVALVGFLIGHRHEIVQFIDSKSASFNEDNEPLSKTLDKKKAAVKPSEPEKVAAPAVAAPEPTPAPVPVPDLPRIEPTRLRAQLQDPGTSKAAIVFDTDGSHHFPIRVTVIGQAGLVLGAVSVYRDVTVRRQREALARLELGSLDLGEGQYSLTAQMKEIKGELKFRVGRDDKEFRRQMDRHRKLISLPFQRERRRLIKASKELYALGLNFRQLSGVSAAAWREGYKRWSESLSKWSYSQLDGLNVNNPKSLVFPRSWQDLVEAHS
ncbi:MAG: GYF domain-containing protein, partial [Bdellovibrionales bacterium]